ncbi:MAG: hypothetical protein Q8N99_04080 [Nanoarchaeota archaeon]|nr:hypothetical protein [Nanoarchaeota archaeon]
MEIDSISESIKDSFFRDMTNLSFNSLFHVPKEYLVGEKRLFGTYYIPYLSEMIGLEDKKKIVEIGNAFIFGRAFVISQDQILDNKERPNIDYLLLSPLLLKEFIVKLQVLIKKFNLEKEVKEILLDSITANKKEQEEHKNKITPYTKNDLENLYFKTGIVGLLPLIICSLINKPLYKDPSILIARSLLVCVQICDDLSDVAEDYNSKNFTFPVTHGILLSKKGKMSMENMYEGLLLSGLLEFLCNFIITTLDKITKEIKKISNEKCQMELYTLNLRNYIKKILEEIDEIKTKKEIPINYNDDFLKLKPLEESKDYSSIIPLLKKFEPANIAPNKLTK